MLLDMPLIQTRFVPGLMYDIKFRGYTHIRRYHTQRAPALRKVLYHNTEDATTLAFTAIAACLAQPTIIAAFFLLSPFAIAASPLGEEWLQRRPSLRCPNVQ